jgi:predicted component of type VI protein secretion system
MTEDAARATRSPRPSRMPLQACIRLLLEAGADPNALSKTRNTPLHNTVNFTQAVSLSYPPRAAARGPQLRSTGRVSSPLP